MIRRKKQETKWKRKLDRSPFCVDLVAENERLDEEIRVRERQEARRQRALEAKREKVSRIHFLFLCVSNGRMLCCMCCVG